MTRQHGTPRDGDSAVIVDLLRQLTTRTDRWIDERGHREGVHRTHLHALAHLMEAERDDRSMTPGELADALRLSAPATTALVDRLVSAGHVERTTHATDRRRTVLVVLPLARETGFAIFGPLARRMTSVVDQLPADERDVVARFLTAIVEQMDPAADG